LEEYQLDGQTLVIFFSDNGGGGAADNRPLRGSKSTMFEGGVRVPCIVRWPEQLPAGAVCDEFLTSLEVFPTVVRAAGATLPSGVTYDGFDMLPVLKGESTSPRREMFWQRRSNVAARYNSWKWVDSDRGGGLFNLAEDIGEQEDLSGEEPEILQQVKSRFQAWQQAMQAAEPRGPFRDY
jgi:arylsulfatase A-like enzyme